uniref:Uncharacterized protein n=1 Tax=Macrostomum lignano TaxID=282301 RepID=A0A1I8IJ30_9PLAT
DACNFPVSVTNQKSNCRYADAEGGLPVAPGGSRQRPRPVRLHAQRAAELRGPEGGPHRRHDSHDRAEARHARPEECPDQHLAQAHPGVQHRQPHEQQRQHHRGSAAVHRADDQLLRVLQAAHQRVQLRLCHQWRRLLLLRGLPEPRSPEPVAGQRLLHPRHHRARVHARPRLPPRADAHGPRQLPHHRLGQHPDRLLLGLLQVQGQRVRHLLRLQELHAVPVHRLRLPPWRPRDAASGQRRHRPGRLLQHVGQRRLQDPQGLRLRLSCQYRHPIRAIL